MTVSRIEFPSERFPSPPRLSLELPVGWSPVALEGTVLAAASDAATGEPAFASTVGVSVRREVSRLGLEDLALLIVTAAQAAGAVNLVESALTVGARDARRLDADLDVGDGLVLRQVTVIVPVRHESALDVVQVVGVARLDDPIGVDELQSVLRGFAIGGSS